MISSSAKYLIALSLLGVSLAASGADELLWHGFVGQGFVYTTDNAFFGNSENVSFELQELGVGALWQPTSRLRLSGQTLYRQAGATSRDDVYLDYGFADLQLYQSSLSQIGVRAGRVKNLYGLYNDTRDIAGAQPSVLLPEGVYFDKWRDVFHTSDSLSLYGSTYMGETLIQADVFRGRPFVSDSAATELLPVPLQGELRNQTLAAGRLLVETLGGALRLAYSRALIKGDYLPRSDNAEVPLGFYGFPGRTDYQLEMYSAEYSYDRWEFSAETSRANLRYDGVIYPGLVVELEPLGYYGSVAFNLTAKLSAFLRYDTIYYDKNDKSGRAMAALTGLPEYSFFAHDNTLGLNWVFDKHWCLGVEVHQVEGTFWLSRSENDFANAVKHWNMLVGKINYNF